MPLLTRALRTGRKRRTVARIAVFAFSAMHAKGAMKSASTTASTVLCAPKTVSNLGIAEKSAKWKAFLKNATAWDVDAKQQHWEKTTLRQLHWEISENRGKSIRKCKNYLLYILTIEPIRAI